MEKKLLLQTKEDIRQEMIAMFSNTIPTIKNLATYPMIVMNDPKQEKINLHWLWILPTKEVITYGENNQNRFFYYPEYKKPICSANKGIVEHFETQPEIPNTLNKTEDFVATLEVTQKFYKKEGQTYEDLVMEYTPPLTKPAEISSLYHQRIICIEE